MPSGGGKASATSWRVESSDDRLRATGLLMLARLPFGVPLELALGLDFGLIEFSFADDPLIVGRLDRAPTFCCVRGGSPGAGLSTPRARLARITPGP